MKNGRNLSRYSDPAANPQFGRRWKFEQSGHQFAHLPAVEAQRERDTEARIRNGLPIPRSSAALFDKGAGA